MNASPTCPSTFQIYIEVHLIDIVPERSRKGIIVHMVGRRTNCHPPEAVSASIVNQRRKCICIVHVRSTKSTPGLLIAFVWEVKMYIIKTRDGALGNGVRGLSPLIADAVHTNMRVTIHPLAVDIHFMWGIAQLEMKLSIAVSVVLHILQDGEQFCIRVSWVLEKDIISFSLKEYSTG